MAGDLWHSPGTISQEMLLNLNHRIYSKITLLELPSDLSYISCMLLGNTMVGYSDVVGALPVGPAPTTSSFST